MLVIAGSHTIRVEPLSPSDVVAIAHSIALDADAFPYASATFGLRDATARILVARDVGTKAPATSPVVAFIAGHVRQAILHIEGLAVDRRSRRLGIARALVREAVANARAERTAGVALHVSVANRGAIALYSSEGFAVRTRLRGFYGPTSYDGETDAYEMELRLA